MMSRVGGRGRLSADSDAIAHLPDPVPSASQHEKHQELVFAFFLNIVARDKKRVRGGGKVQPLSNGALGWVRFTSCCESPPHERSRVRNASILVWSPWQHFDPGDSVFK